MINKRGFEFSFAWMFAIFVGAVIIFLAVYAATRFVDTEKQVQNTGTAKQIETLLTPVETGLESGKTANMKFTDNTRINNICNSLGTFGEQKVQVTAYSDLGGWGTAGVPITSYNKYIFSKSTVEGRSIDVFTKPFSMPYKVGDIIILWSEQENYCFVNPPTEIENELNRLNLSGVKITSDTNDCGKGLKSVCFENGNCEILVNYNEKSVTKDKKVVYYEDSADNSNSLLYAAIFSDAGIYECQLKRLMKRTSALASLYATKSVYLGADGCASYLQADLLNYANNTYYLNNSVNIKSIKFSSDDIQNKNDQISGCKLF